MKTIVLGTLLVAGIAIALPLAGAGPVGCMEGCTVEGWSGGFVPPASLVQSGGQISWSSLDGNAHVNFDAGVGGETCFQANYGPGGDSEPIRFDIVAGTLQAVAQPGTPNETATSCPNAVPVDGGFLLNYFCGLHPVLMKGALVVVP